MPKQRKASLADLPPDVRNIIATHVEKTWMKTPRGKAWQGTSAGYVEKKISELKRKWDRRWIDLEKAIWFVPTQRKEKIRNEMRATETHGALKTIALIQSDRIAQLKARKDRAYRIGLLIRKCKRASP
jgi:hypothetical protein